MTLDQFSGHCHSVPESVHFAGPTDRRDLIHPEILETNLALVDVLIDVSRRPDHYVGRELNIIRQGESQIMKEKSTVIHGIPRLCEGGDKKTTRPEIDNRSNRADDQDSTDDSSLGIHLHPQPHRIQGVL